MYIIYGADNIVMAAGSTAPSGVSDWCTDFAGKAAYTTLGTGVVLPLGYLDYCWTYIAGLWAVIPGKEAEVAARAAVSSPSLVYIDTNLPQLSLTLFFRLAADGSVDKLIARITGIGTFSQMPTHLSLLLTVEENANKVAVVDHGTYLSVLSTEVLETGIATILAGSSTTRLVMTTAANPLDLTYDLKGMYWASVAGGPFRKAISFDETSFTFSDPFPTSPVVGDTFAWGRIAFRDERSADYRLLALQNSSTGQTEIIKWGDVEYISGEYRLTEITRSQEGTSTCVNADAVYYFPTVGAGSLNYNIPISDFVQTGPQTFDGAVDISVAVPAGAWISGAFCTAFAYSYGSATRIARSYLQPITDWRQL